MGNKNEFNKEKTKRKVFLYLDCNKALLLAMTEAKKNPDISIGVFRIKSLAVFYFHMSTLTLSSTLSGFTSEFGMGSGGSRLLWPPGKNGIKKQC